MTRQNWRMWEAALDVEPILKAGSQAGVSKATTFGGENKDVRRSRVAWLTENKSVKELILPYAQDAANVMGIDIDSNCEIQFTEYHATENGHYDWHHDVDWNNNNGVDRKLSLTLQLTDSSEYEGGLFDFGEVEKLPPNYRTKGTVLVFPSYLSHRVSPVTSGVRRSLVAWFSGPTWR